MSNNNRNVITVNTGSGFSEAEMAAFFRNAGAVQSSLSSMRQTMRGFGSAISSAVNGFSRLADYAKGLVSSLMHAQNLAAGLETGLSNLYKWGRTYWREFSSSLDRLATSALYLRNSLGALAAPLLNALAPAIDYVTDRLVDLFNLINQVIARLTGSATYVAAVKTADAWDSVRGRISRATSALKRYIAGFDQLNVLSDGSAGSSGGDSSGGGGGGGSSAMFETREIESSLAGFVDSLRAAFEASDWQTLGTLIGEKVNEIVERVDWAALGAQVGYYVNALFSTAYWTLETVNFENIGAAVAEFLNSALAEIDFSKVGGTVALLFTSFYETVAGFVQEFDWNSFAEDLAEGVNGFFSTLGEHLDGIDWAGLALRLTEGVNTFIAKTDWANLGSTLGGRFNDLLAVLGTAAAEFDWSGAGAALAEAVNGLFRRVDWDALGDWLNATLQGVLDFSLAFVNGFDAEGFADGVGKALSRVDWDAVSAKLWELFSTALKKLGEFVGTILFGGTADCSFAISLLRDNWSTIAEWLGFDPNDPVVNMMFNLLVGKLESEAQKALEAEDKDVTTTENLKNGTVNADAQKTRDAENKSTTTTVNAKQGSTFDGKAFAATQAIDKTKTTTVNAKQGSTFDSKAFAATQAIDKTKTTTVNAKQGSTFDGKAFAATQAIDKTKTTTVNTKQGSTFDGKAFAATQAIDKTKTTTVNTKQGSTWDGKAFAATQAIDKTKTTTVNTKQGSTWDDKAYKATQAKDRDTTTKVKLEKKSGSSDTISTIVGWSSTVKKTVKVYVEKAGNVWTKITDTLKKWGIKLAVGGVVTNAGGLRRFASGGVIRGGMAEYLSSVPHYASGTRRAHGTVFVAGEAGPEVMGHINGRTEILNKSQIAQAIYSAVVAGVGRAVNALGPYLAGQMAACTNAVTASVGALQYRQPALATGSVLPYDVAAQIARSGEDLQSTLNANNEDLIQTVISVAGQIVAAVQAIDRSGTRQNTSGGLTARQLIDEINRRTQMFGGSPLMG